MTSESQPLTVLSHTTSQGVTLVISGELDIATAPRLQDAALDALNASASPKPALHLDLHAVSFMDSSGVQVLAKLRKRAEQVGGHVAVVRVSSSVARVLDLLGLLELYTEDDPSCTDKI